MIHLKSYQPTHEQMARVEHAIVVNRRKLFTLRESHDYSRMEEVNLELDYLNLCYWKHHSQGASTPIGRLNPDCIPRLENRK